MKITEIITNPIRDEYIEHKSVYFTTSPVISKIRNLELKKTTHDNELWYGLFDPTSPIPNCLVAILQLGKYNDALYQVRLSQVAQVIKGQGYGTFLYDYAVMNDGLSFLSDSTNTEGGLGGSKGLWEKLYRQGRYTVSGYDIDTNTVIPNIQPANVYNQKENIVWLATPKVNPETINEMLTRLNYNKDRQIVWYGPSIVESSNF